MKNNGNIFTWLFEKIKKVPTIISHLESTSSNEEVPMLSPRKIQQSLGRSQLEIEDLTFEIKDKKVFTSKKALKNYKTFAELLMSDDFLYQNILRYLTPKEQLPLASISQKWYQEITLKDDKVYLYKKAESAIKILLLGNGDLGNKVVNFATDSREKSPEIEEPSVGSRDSMAEVLSENTGPTPNVQFYLFKGKVFEIHGIYSELYKKKNLLETLSEYLEEEINVIILTTEDKPNLENNFNLLTQVSKELEQDLPPLVLLIDQKDVLISENQPEIEKFAQEKKIEIFVLPKIISNELSETQKQNNLGFMFSNLSVGKKVKPSEKTLEIVETQPTSESIKPIEKKDSKKVTDFFALPSVTDKEGFGIREKMEVKENTPEINEEDDKVASTRQELFNGA